MLKWNAGQNKQIKYQEYVTHLLSYKSLIRDGHIQEIAIKIKMLINPLPTMPNLLCFRDH